MLASLNTLNISARNWAPNRSFHVKFLNRDKSQFLKPESRKMFRPILPRVPFLGGTTTPLLPTKHPAAARVVGSGATAVHFPYMAADSDEEKLLGPKMLLTAQPPLVQ